MAIDWSKKVGGVPVVYIGAGAAAILAVVAWRMKPSTSGDTTDPTTGEDAVLDENGIADGSNPYAGYSTNGTVIVQPAPVTPEDSKPQRPDTNDEWVREGAEWLVANKNVSGTAAYTALTKYIEGKSRSTTEQTWIELVIKEKGFPPDPFIDGPPATTPPETKPGNTNPPPGRPTPAPGSKPGYGWYQVKAGDSAASIAAKYGISVTQFYAYNGPGRIAAGDWVKVRYASNPITGYRG